MSDTDSPPENLFYEHLTELIRLFKTLLLAFDDTHALMRSDHDYDQAVLRLRNILAQEEDLAQRFDLSLEAHRHLHRYCYLHPAHINDLSADWFKI